MTITDDTPIATGPADRQRNVDLILGAYRLAEMGAKDPAALSRFNAAKNLLAAAVIEFDEASVRFHEAFEAAANQTGDASEADGQPTGTALGARLDAGALLEKRKNELVNALIDLVRGADHGA